MEGLETAGAGMGGAGRQRFLLPVEEWLLMNS